MNLGLGLGNWDLGFSTVWASLNKVGPKKRKKINYFWLFQVFAAMFQANMREREEGRVAIDDLSSTVLKQMLEFMYTGEPPDVSEADDLIGLLGAAAKYEIGALQVKINIILKCKIKLLSIK
jgi:hypothetical protein